MKPTPDQHQITKGEVMVAIREKWRYMSESDVQKAVDVIWDAAEAKGTVLVSLHTTTAYVAVKHGWPWNKLAAPLILGYIHAGHVDLFRGGFTPDERVKLTNYDPRDGGPRTAEPTREVCPNCFVQKSLDGSCLCD